MQNHKGRKKPGAELRPTYQLSHKGCRHVAERHIQIHVCTSNETLHSNDNNQIEILEHENNAILSLLCSLKKIENLKRNFKI